MANEIKAGSIVELLSDSIQEMTVLRVGATEAEVIWFDHNKNLQQRPVPLVALRLSVSDPEHKNNQDVDDGTTAV